MVGDRGRVAFFVTDNRVSPVVALYDVWPSSARLVQSCRRGLYLGCRPMTAREAAAVSESPRCSAWSWSSLPGMLWDERAVGGRRFGLLLTRVARRERATVERLLGIAAAKRRARDAKRDRAASERAGQRRLALGGAR